MEALGVGTGFLMLLWMLFCGLYAILIFFIPFILYGIMRNTKRTADILTQIRSFQTASPEPGSTNISGPALPKQSIGSLLLEKPPGAPSQASGETYNFATQKWESTYTKTDKK
jgi:hypothetical protein